MKTVDGWNWKGGQKLWHTLHGEGLAGSNVEVSKGEYQAGWRAVATRSHLNTPRKTARERAVYVINRGAMAEDIEKQIQLAVKAYAKRKANQK